MNKRIVLSLAAGMSLMTTGPAPASTKPCRSKDGRIIECPKARKHSPPVQGRQRPVRGVPDPLKRQPER